MKKMTYIWPMLLLPLLFAGCDSSSLAKQYLSEVYCSLPFTCSGKDREVLSLRENYLADYEITGSAVQALNKNDVRAASAGAVSWNKKQKPPVYIKVWWQVIYDVAKSNQDTKYDQELEKRPRNGTVWCEAIVKIKEPYPADPSFLDIYFFPDGHIEAEVTGYIHTPEGYLRGGDERQYTDAEKAALPRRHDGKLCDKTIDNPWFGIDTSNPWT